MKSIFGANWPTTLWGGLFTFALFLALNPNALDGLIPTDWARVLVRWAVLITGFVAFYRTKDKNVSGNGSLDDPTRKAGPNGRSEIVE
jgi:hypothetical protein